jgi:transcriptional regulator with XRE-family HTH domain
MIAAHRPASSLAARLREIIRESGLSGFEVAKRAGLNHTVVSRFMNGSRAISLESIERLAPVLKLRLVAPSGCAKAK